MRIPFVFPILAIIAFVAFAGSPTYASQPDPKKCVGDNCKVSVPMTSNLPALAPSPNCKCTPPCQCNLPPMKAVTAPAAPAVTKVITKTVDQNGVTTYREDHIIGDDSGGGGGSYNPGQSGNVNAGRNGILSRAWHRGQARRSSRRQGRQTASADYGYGYGAPMLSGRRVRGGGCCGG